MQDGGSASIRGQEDGHSGQNSDPNLCFTFLKGNGSDNAVIRNPLEGLLKKNIIVIITNIIVIITNRTVIIEISSVKPIIAICNHFAPVYFIY